MNDTLHLPLKAKWYDMIESGEKREEYREIKPHWIKRFCGFWKSGIFQEGRDNCKKIGCIKCKEELDYMNRIFGEFSYKIHKYDRVCFSYGYTKRRMTWEVERIRMGYGKPEWGAPEDEAVFIIKLGRRIA